MIRGEPAAAAAGSLFLDRCTPGVFPALIFAAGFPEISGHWAGLIIFKSADIKCCMEVTVMIPAASATASPTAAWAFKKNCSISCRRAASIPYF